jgi:ABC-2 type transport system permease protein
MQPQGSTNLLSAIWTLAWKDLRLLLRDKAGFFFTFIFPIGFAIFFGVLFGGSGAGSSTAASPAGSTDKPAATAKLGAVRVLVVDLDQTPASIAFAKTLADASELITQPESSRDAAIERVRTGSIPGAIIIEPGFGKGQENLFANPGESTITITVDPSRKAEGAMLEGILQKYAFSQMGSVLSNPANARKQIQQARQALITPQTKLEDRLLFETFFAATNRFLSDLETRQTSDTSSSSPTPAVTQAFSPITIKSQSIARKRSGPTNAFAISFPQGMIWGVMGAAMGFAASFVMERTGGTFSRLITSPLPVWAVIAGKALACWITCLGILLGMLAVGAIFFGVSPTSWPLTLAAAFLVSFAFIGIMLIIAALAPTERAASGIGWAILMVLAFIGGVAVPTFVMPTWMQSLAQFSPMHWAMRALEGGMWRDLSPQQMLLPGLILLAIASIGLIAAHRTIARRQHHT